jgi:hypothetical protein
VSSTDKKDMTTSYSIDISLKTDLSINDKFMQHQTQTRKKQAKRVILMRITTAVLTIIDVNATASSSPLCLTLARNIHNPADSSFTDHFSFG